MPTYDYRCLACGHEFEQFQTITSKPIRKCPECGKLKCKRLIGTGAGIIFKGSGFYETDYRSDSYKQSAKADSDAAAPKAKDDKPAKDKPAATEKKAEPKTPTKPAKTSKPD